MFATDPLDVRLAVGHSGRARCQLCEVYFNLAECEAGISGICPDCIAREPRPTQDNLPEGEDGYLPPRELPEVVVARLARREAEMRADRTLLALAQHHQILAAIAAANLGRRPLRLFPKEQSKLAVHALEMLRQNFPDIAEQLDLPHPVESR